MDTYCYICYYNSDTDLSPLKKLLPMERFKELERFPEHRRRQSMLAEALLRRKIYERMGEENIIITRRADGKPECTLCEISISHTQGAVAVAFSDDPIGIDIERLREGRMRAAKAYFTAVEYEFAKRSPDTVFWEIWTRKEAYAKAHDIGLSARLAEIDTVLSPASKHFYTQTEPNFTYSIYSKKTFSVFETTATEFISIL